MKTHFMFFVEQWPINMTCYYETFIIDSGIICYHFLVCVSLVFLKSNFGVTFTALKYMLENSFVVYRLILGIYYFSA